MPIIFILIDIMDQGIFQFIIILFNIFGYLDPWCDQSYIMLAGIRIPNIKVHPQLSLNK